MALPACSVSVVHQDSLGPWQGIGKGGFGMIFKAKHKTWMTDVAIKVLRSENSHSLQQEAELMIRSSNPYVLSIRGVYKPTGTGAPEVDGCHAQFGLVMDYMERGSLRDLLKALRGPAPWSLTARILHQIALGMNYLHQLTPPLLHMDLKPSNVLLDDSLNAKITDFGLAKIVPRSSSSVSQKNDIGGTTNYMPPEAFDDSYKPAVPFDVYSYAIVLWVAIVGKEPYEKALYTTQVKFRVREGDRPDMKLIEGRKEEQGHGDLKGLMESCWDGNPQNRPSFKECIEITEKVYTLCKNGVNKDVHSVLEFLKKREDELSSSFDSLGLSSKEDGGNFKENSSHAVKAEAPPTQESGATSKVGPKGSHTRSLKQKQKPPHPPPHRPPHHHPSSSSGPGPKHYRAPNNLARPKNIERHFSNPGPGSTSITNSTGVQIGDNNTIIINDKQPRQRHPTAPSTISRT